MRRIVLVCALAVSLAACNGKTDGSDCPEGSEGCPCRPAGTCEVGLTCIDAVCVTPAGQGDGMQQGDPYDPDPNFRILGTLKDAAGLPSGEGVTVHVYRAPSILDVARDLLNFTTIAEAGQGKYETRTVQTDADSAFFLSMTPAEVAPGIDFFTVVYFEGGVEDAQLASATNWRTFTADRREWDVGELALWDAPTASQTTPGDTGVLTFDWTSNPAPSGRVSSIDVPAYLFAWDEQTFEDRWQAYFFSDSLELPRGVFPNNLSLPPEYFVVSSSMPAGGGDPFQHRTSVKSVEATGWSTTGGVNRITGNFASIHQGTVGNRVWDRDTPSEAMDDDLGTPFEFDPDVADIYVDLGGGDVGIRILLYNLTVSRLHNAVIRLEGSERAVPTTNWVDLGEAYRGSWQGDNWLYLATDGTTVPYQSFHLWLEPKEPGGQQPYFLTVAEIKAAH